MSGLRDEHFLQVPAIQSDRSDRSEEHTSELQSHSDLVCRLLLEKKKKKIDYQTPQSLRSFPIIRVGATELLHRCISARAWQRFRDGRSSTGARNRADAQRC